MGNQHGSWKRIWPYALAFAVVYLLIFPLARFVGDKGILIVGLLLVLPLFHLGVGVLYGRKYGFRWELFALAALVFIPALLIFLNSSAWIYLGFYFLLLVVGQGTGLLTNRKRRLANPLPGAVTPRSLA
ncbi:MAG: hypothetical protein LBB58_05850 [Cellulomonadaceae bacterium]|jgi:hypothetical protein|nr:hypothetical protein [Cellulomonadaceae bacterium]